MPLRQLLAATTTVVAVALVMTGLAPVDAAAQSSPKGAEEAAARVGNDVIPLEELERALSTQLGELDRQRHALLSRKLDELISERLLAQEAARRGVSVEQLLATHVEARTPEVTDAEVAALIAQNRAQIPSGMDENELALRVRNHLRAQKAAQVRQNYLQTLRAATQITTLLKEPPVLRVEVNPAKGIVKGTADAQVTIVEFTDFQCPFCKKATSTLYEVLAHYKGKVKLVFRDYPIPTLHPGAPKVHEAARCAGAQGKFWEYHDMLFERAPRHATDELKRYAEELKLDAASFAQCLDSGRYQADVKSDVEEGNKLGINGTPTFFINGRVLVGAQPLAEFKKVIDKEIAPN
jgi:protein-disulfide isomerase